MFNLASSLCAILVDGVKLNSIQMLEVLHRYALLQYTTAVGDTTSFSSLFDHTNHYCRHECFHINSQNLSIHDLVHTHPSRSIVYMIEESELNNHFVGGTHPFDANFIREQHLRLIGRKKATQRWLRLQPTARLLQRICMFWVDIYNEVTFRPGHQGYIATEKAWRHEVELSSQHTREHCSRAPPPPTPG